MAIQYFPLFSVMYVPLEFKKQWARLGPNYMSEESDNPDNDCCH